MPEAQNEHPELASSSLSGISHEPDLHSSQPEYAQRFSGSTGAYFLKVQSDALLQLISPWPNAHVLDVGGGHCQTCAILTKTGYTVTVLGSSDAALERVRREVPPIAQDAIVGSLIAPPVPNQSYDVVISFRMISHVADWKELIAALCRSARSAVIIDFAIPSGSNALEPLLFGAKKRLEGNTRRFRVISKQDVRAEFAKNGFTVDAEIGQFVLPMAVHRALKVPTISKFLEGVLNMVGLHNLFGTPVIVRARRTASIAKG